MLGVRQLPADTCGEAACHRLGPQDRGRLKGSETRPDLRPSTKKGQVFFMKVQCLRAALACSVAIASLCPALGHAQSSDLESRVRALEAALSAVQAQLEVERARNAVTPETLKPVTDRISAVETRLAAPPADGFKVGGATIKFGGFVKAEGLYTRFNDGPTPATVAGGTTSREFYVPGATPVGGRADDAHFNGHIKQTRLSMTVTPSVAGHTMSAYVEGDFESAAGGQGTQNVTNGYNFAVRRAFLTYDKWLIGQEWTSFMNVAAFPETTDFIGPTDGIVFARNPMVRYTTKLNDKVSLVLAAENPETVTTGIGAGALSGGQDDEMLPDIVARLNFKFGKGEFSLSGLLRQLSVEDTATNFDEQATGWGISLAGKVPFGEGNKHDVRFALTTGDGIGRYVGLGFASDALAINRPAVQPNNQALEPLGVTAGFGVVRFVTTPKSRINLGYSFQTVDNVTGLSAATANEQSQSVFANYFYSPVKGLDLGLEYRHAIRELFNGTDGSMDRVHIVAKQSF
jgi:DcaP outer membrane protein